MDPSSPKLNDTGSGCDVSFVRFLRSRWIVVALLGSVLVLAGIWVISSKQERQQAEVSAGRNLSDLSSEVVHEMAELIKRESESVRFLAKLPPVRGIVRSTQAGGIDPIDGSTLGTWKARLETIFEGYLESNPDVYQIRYIGAANGGQELVRVEREDGSLRTRSGTELQTKGNRPYLQQVLALGKDDIYLSELSLNREFGRVQVPHRPTLRFITPVVDDNWKAFGAVAINVDMSRYISRLKERNGPYQIYLLNQHGDYLYHPEPGHAFGFELGERHRFTDDFVEDMSWGRSKLSGPARSYRTPKGLSQVVLRTIPLKSTERGLQVAAVATLSQIHDQADQVVSRSLWLSALSCSLALVGLFLFWRHTERQLWAHNERLRLVQVVEHAHDAIIGLDLEGRVLSWNDAAERLFGYPRTEAIGSHIDELIVIPGDPGVDLGAVDRGEKEGHQARRRRRDGSSVDIWATVSPLRDSKGSIVGAAKVVRDYSEQKAYQERIERMNDSLERQVEERTERIASFAALQRAMLQSARYAMVATDPDGKITLFNPAAERMLSYTSSEVIGARPSKFLLKPGDANPNQLDPLSEARNIQFAHLTGAEQGAPTGGFSVSDEIESLQTFMRKDGSKLCVLLGVSPVQSPEGALIGYLCIAVDQTERIQREEELRLAREQAISASSAKSQFLANMSHEIRTPMNAVQGMLQLLHRTPLSEAQADYTKKAERAARTLLGILNDILDLSKIEANKLLLSNAPFTMSVLLDDLAAIISSTLGTKDIDVILDIDPHTPRVLLGDVLRLQQVLLNLISNAIKFTSEGEIVVKLNTKLLSAKRVILAFSVRDTGLGMDASQLERVFDSFVQAETSTTRRFGGTGLGLAISRRLVELMGGTLEGTSSPGQGTTFYFSIELDVEKTVAIGPHRAPLTTKKNVVIIHSYETARGVLSKVVTELGCRSSTWATWTQWIESLDLGATVPDIILLDERLVSSSQTDELRNLRESNPGLRTLLLHRQAHEQQNDHFDGFVTMPVTATALSEALEKASGSTSGVDSERTPSMRLKGFRLLVIEDMPINQQIASELLRSEGAIVTIAESGSVALATLSDTSESFDLILMDLQMPDLDGYETTQKIREISEFDLLPIVAMTANAMTSDRLACLNAGMNGHIAKPFHIDEVVEQLLPLIDATKHTGHADSIVPATPLLPGVQEENMNSVAPVEIDIASAAARLGGDRKLYWRVVQNVLETKEFDKQSLDSLLLVGKRKDFLRKIHTLKGLAATLGASSLALEAKQLEILAAKEPENASLVTALDKFCALLLATRDELARQQASQTVVISSSSSCVKTEITNTSSMTLNFELKRLHGLLGTRNLEALDLHRRLAAALASLSPDTSSALESAVSRLDFTQAQALCVDLQKNAAG